MLSDIRDFFYYGDWILYGFIAFAPVAVVVPSVLLSDLFSKNACLELAERVQASDVIYEHHKCHINIDGVWHFNVIR